MEKKIEKKIEKKNIKTYAASGLLAVSLLTTGVAFYDSTVSHDHEWCPLNYIFGLQHQADKINNGYNGWRHEAVIVPEDKFETIPEGYKQYQGYYGQHVVEYVSYYKETYKPLENESVYAIDDGFLEENAIPFGEERIEVYDYNDVSEDPQLIRIFKY